MRVDEGALVGCQFKPCIPLVGAELDPASHAERFGPGAARPGRSDDERSGTGIATTSTGVVGGTRSRILGRACTQPFV